ncbi:hypothetical protein MHU86_5421 [Fragilaria crotonensis]|nr:hypothetical protein MHU86_5421 [Fragilaria crotonensis]
MVDHFGLGRQQSSPSCAPPPNARVRSPFGSSFSSSRSSVNAPKATSRRFDGPHLLLRSLAINVVASRLLKSRSLRHASIQAFASTSSTVPTPPSPTTGYVASRPPTVASATTFVTSRLSKNAHSVSNVAPTRFAIRRPAPLPPTGQRERIQQTKRSCPPGAPNAHVRRHEPRSIALWHPPTRPTRSQSLRTFHQRAAANKILSHVHLACHSTPLAWLFRLRSNARSPRTKKTSPIIWDSGASISITPDLSDFEGPVTSPGTITQLKGIAKGLQIKGQGEVTGCPRSSSKPSTSQSPAFHVPNIKVRLLSTSSLLQTYPDETITIEPNRLTLSGVPNDANRGPVTANVNPQNNLPTSEAYNATDPFKAADALVSIVTPSTKEPQP